MSEILAAGYDTTNELDQIDASSLDVSSLIFVDGFEWGDTLSWSGEAP